MTHPVLEPNWDWEGFDFDTRQVHAGEEPDRTHGSRVTPIHLSNAFRFDSFEATYERFAGIDPGQLYSRHLNPTNVVAERRIASLESGTGAVTVASGTAAIAVTLLGLLQAGEHLVSTASIYSGTRTQFDRTLRRAGISVDYVEDWRDETQWSALFRPETRAVFTESIPNPKNDIVDVAFIARIAHAAGVPLVVDNTAATPYLLRPIEHGADIVVHSSTKFLTGHGAGLSGVIVDGGSFDWAASGRDYAVLTNPAGNGTASYLDRYGRQHALAEYLRSAPVNDLGPALSPFNGFLLQQGLETLSLRMERHVSNASAIAHWLDAQPEVESVDYAGLPNHRDHDLAQRLYGGRTGSVFSFTVSGGRAGAQRFIDSVRVFSRMTNIGDTRSLVLNPATTTHGSFSEETRQSLGIWPGLIRLSVGIESVDDLIGDLRNGLDALGPTRARIGPRAELPAS